MGVSSELGGGGDLRASLSLLSSTSNHDNNNNKKQQAFPRSASSSSSSSSKKLYSLFKTAMIRKSLQQQQDRLQAKQMKIALETYRRKGRVCLTIAKTAYPKILDHRGDYRHRKAFTVKPNPDGTFLPPKRLQPKRWRGSMTCIGETKELLFGFDDGEEMLLMIQTPAVEEQEEDLNEFSV